jgi:hypothetical protein
MRGVRYAAILVALCAALAVSLPGGATTPRRASVLALIGNGTTESLARLDPATLRPVSGRRSRISVGLHDIPHAFSPDQSLLAIGSGRTSSVLVVDLAHMRLVGRLATHFTAALEWLSSERLVLIENDRDALSAWVLTVEQSGLRIAARLPLPAASELTAMSTAAGSLVLLLGPQGALGHASLAVVDGDGVRTAMLEQIAAGSTVPNDSESIVHFARPGLAVDAAANRAFVVSGDGLVAEVDLASLAVSYHQLTPAARRPQAVADGGGGNLGEGSTRIARWVGEGRFVMTGGDDVIAQGPNGPVQRHEEAGLRLVDTSTWTETILEKDVVWFAWTGRFIVGQSYPHPRLVVYDSNGDRFRRALAANGVQVAGSRAYLTLGNEYSRHRVRVVDLESGRTTRTVTVPGWFYPLRSSTPESCWC